MRIVSLGVVSWGDIFVFGELGVNAKRKYRLVLRRKDAGKVRGYLGAYISRTAP
jgi:hypothetical protein